MDELICICTEPPSDSARRAGMSWGGVSETIRGACPLCQGEDGCPPECRSLTLTRIEEKLEEALPGLIQTGGWCAPSHEEVFGYPDPLNFPKVQIKRGGIRHDRFVVSTHVFSRKPHWWNRRTWHLRVQTWNGEEIVTAVLDLDSKARAEAAELMVKLCAKSINQNYFKELDSAR